MDSNLLSQVYRVGRDAIPLKIEGFIVSITNQHTTVSSTWIRRSVDTQPRSTPMQSKWIGIALIIGALTGCIKEPQHHIEDDHSALHDDSSTGPHWQMFHLFGTFWICCNKHGPRLSFHRHPTHGRYKEDESDWHGADPWCTDRMCQGV